MIGSVAVMSWGSAWKIVKVAVFFENFFTASVETRVRFPHCFCDVIAFPLNKECVLVASPSMVDNGFDFPSLFVVVDVWWWSKEVRSVSFRFGVWHE